VSFFTYQGKGQGDRLTRKRRSSQRFARACRWTEIDWTVGLPREPRLN